MSIVNWARSVPILFNSSVRGHFSLLNADGITATTTTTAGDIANWKFKVSAQS